MTHQPLYKRILSYLYPVTIARATTSQNAVLELCLYRDRFQLATKDALYSDGNKYRPLVLAFKHLGKKLDNVNEVLVLGTGLGSAAHILYDMGYKPRYTFVEHDQTILNWAVAILPAGIQNHVTGIFADAQTYIDMCSGQYNMIIADIFNSRIVPEFVTSASFLHQCRRCIIPGGYFVLNYMIVNEGA